MEWDSKVRHWEWCRAFIEEHCILRSPPGTTLLTSRGKGGVPSSWQFYMPVAVLDQQFAYRIATMFWEYFGPKMPFQICACESGGVPLLSAVQAQRPVNGFVIKKKAKAYGLMNWLEGIVDPDVPVLLLDDLTGSGRTLSAQATRLTEMGLTLCPEVFCIAACQSKGARTIKVGEQELSIKSFYAPTDFVTSYGGYVAKYGTNPQFLGTIV